MVAIFAVIVMMRNDGDRKNERHKECHQPLEKVRAFHAQFIILAKTYGLAYVFDFLNKTVPIPAGTTQGYSISILSDDSSIKNRCQ
jgi:hypothetical protein